MEAASMGPNTAMELQAELRALYERILTAWNERRAADFAAAFAEDGEVVGFDGSQMAGRQEIAATLQSIFDDHLTGRYVGIVRSVRRVGPEAALLRAVSGVVPHGQTDLNPQLNSIQALLAVRRAGEWQAVLYQNTPAQFHGRPDVAQQLTDELRQAWPQGGGQGS
jgi:uncharacterized protein (TIGR02246 family)